MTPDVERLLVLAAIGACIGLSVGAVRYGVINGVGARTAARGIAASGLVGIGAWWGLDSITWWLDFDRELPIALRGLVTLLCAYVGGDILHGVRHLGMQLGADPIGMIDAIWGSLRGGKLKRGGEP